MNTLKLIRNLAYLLLGGLIMAHGTPDWGQAKTTTVFSQVDDLAELAARLGSAVTYDRRGNVIYLDDFSRGMAQWGVVPCGGGGEVRLSAHRCMSPPFSLLIKTGNVTPWASVATFEVCYKVLGRIGLEYAFTHTVSSQYHFFNLIHYDGERRRNYGIIFFIQDGIIKVKDGISGNETIATGLNLKSDAFRFLQGKLVIDTVNNRFVRFMFNDETYDLSDYVPVDTSDTQAPYLEVSVQFTGDEGAQRSHYIDNVIITQNEP